MYEPKRFKYSDPLDIQRTVLKTCFDLEEKARYSQLLKDFTAATANYRPIESVVKRTSDLTFARKSAFSQAESSGSSSSASLVIPDNSPFPWRAQRRLSKSHKLQIGHATRLAYQDFTAPMGQRSGKSFESRASATEPGALNVPSGSTNFTPGTSGQSSTHCSTLENDNIEPLLRQTKESLKRLYINASPVTSPLSSHCNTSLRYPGEEDEHFPTEQKIVNGFYKETSPKFLLLDNDNIKQTAETMNDQNQPCTSEGLVQNQGTPSASFLAKKDFSYLTEKFNTDPQRLCEIIRTEYSPHAQVRKNEADRLLLEAKLRLEARRAYQENAEEEIRLRIRLEGLILPEKEVKEEADLVSLTEDQLNVIRVALRKRANEVLISKFDINITPHDLEKLNVSNWLNDEIVNFYFNLIMERSAHEKLPSVHVFSTYFYPKLAKTGHAGLKRWTKKVDIFSKDIILVPVHVGEVHWCLAVIDFRKKSISYYDSMGGSNDTCLCLLRKYIQDECLDKKKVEFDYSDWEAITVRNIPHQMNGSDCGVFACKFADYASRDASINFDQTHMPNFRMRMMYEVLTGHL